MLCTRLSSILFNNQRRNFTISTLLPSSIKSTGIDRSKLPILKEEELEETFIKGGGPGGSNVNKTVSCVCLKHIPTGTVIKCQFSRLLHQNRELARERLVEKLDELFNGEMSIKSQKERLLKEKSLVASNKSKNRHELKQRYKKHLQSSVEPTHCVHGKNSEVVES